MNKNVITDDEEEWGEGATLLDASGDRNVDVVEEETTGDTVTSDRRLVTAVVNHGGIPILRSTLRMKAWSMESNAFAVSMKRRKWGICLPWSE